MGFLRQTWTLTATGLRSLPSRLGASLVTLIGVTTVVGVLVSLLALEQSVAGMIGRSREDVATVLSRGAPSPPASVITRETLLAVMDAPGVKRSPDGQPYVAGSTLVGVDAIRNDGTRGTVYFVGSTPGTLLVDADIKIIEGRRYQPAVRELIVSDSIRKLFRGFGVGDRITLRGTQWTVVGVFTTSSAMGSSILRADAATVMSAFDVNTYQEARVVLTSPTAFQTFKDALTTNPAIKVDVKREVQLRQEVFGSFVGLLNFVAYFIGGIMAIGAICGAFNSLYASVDARRRELATLRALGFGGASIVASVLAEGMLLALPGALFGAAAAWMLFNGHQTSVAGFVLQLEITPQLLWVSVLWALAIGLIGASLPAMQVIRMRVANGLRAT